jgi:DNA transformation protein
MSDKGFVNHCLELLSPLGSTSSRRMFGGHALYIDGLCMALIIQDTLYLKVDEANRAQFERAGCRPFTYAGKNDEVHVMSYWTAPEEAMESPAEMLPWARRGLAAAVAARAKTPPAKKKAAAKKAVAAEVPATKAVAKKVVAKKAAARNAVARKAAKP